MTGITGAASVGVLSVAHWHSLCASSVRGRVRLHSADTNQLNTSDRAFVQDVFIHSVPNSLNC